MLALIVGFLVFQVVYHIVVVIGGYGFGLLAPEKIAILRDGIRILICFFSFFYYKNTRKLYCKYWWKMVLMFVVLCGFWVLLSYRIFEKSWHAILVGIKYGLWYFVILLLAGGLGYGLFYDQYQKKEKKEEKSEWWWRISLVEGLKWGLVVIVVVGRVWQLLKLLFPDVFHVLGYGKLDDYHFGVSPPLYYLTGFEGTLRWQGLFSGPNNYGYFLVAFLPVILTLFPIGSLKTWKSRTKQDWIALSVVLLWLITLGATLSRAALIGAVIVFMLYYAPLLRKHKKVLIRVGIILWLGLLGLSLIKWESTLMHIQQKFSWLIQAVEHPLGYGLGSSGPAVHHSGQFLPENFYLQILLDIGTVGFLLWCSLMFLIGKQQYRLRQLITLANEDQYKIYQIFLAFQKGFLALLVIAMFLHVFEDSMVNYLFFVGYGVAWGYLQALVEQTSYRWKEK